MCPGVSPLVEDGSPRVVGAQLQVRLWTVKDLNTHIHILLDDVRFESAKYLCNFNDLSLKFMI